MPLTYVNIASNVLSSTTAAVTFSSIPSTYTDLVIRYSGRGTGGGDWGPLEVTINGTAGTAYSYTVQRGQGGAGTFSTRGTNDSRWYADYSINQTITLANTFANGEIYFPNYTNSLRKTISIFNVGEINSTFGYTTQLAGLTTITSTISSITLADPFGWAAGSSFYLYGIKNS